MTIKEALASNNPIDDITISGWVRTRRDSKGFSFLSINDGSCLANIQAIVDDGIPGSESISMATTGSSIKLTGQLVESPGKGQSFEIKALEIEVTGTADDTYPLQKKGHSQEFLREIAHLRPRSNLFGCVFRTRSRLAYAIHQFFQEKGFVYVHTPIITASDCEGAGEMFRVTTLDGNQTDKKDDFFGKPTYLTVSGQLEVETFACALSNVYTFGPTFRAENSNTTRHASEFWMIEPEMAHCDLEGDMDLAEEMIQYLIKDTLQHCAEDLELFGKFVDKGLLERLHSVSDQAFQRISYTEAVKILKKSGMEFEYPIEWGINLQTEHERFLTEEYFKSPVTVHDYPKSIKPFYMRINDDGKTSAAMDLLVPGIGEIIGGSQREERLDVLMKNMEENNISKKDYSWYSDLRRYGTVPHSGFGLGFERMLMFVTGVANIRDVIPFPRTPGSADF
ncbi:MAG TPA: asparagine--tRNA ligase [Verrucomicrobia bacterium]|nr:asparagine--tRNA ligase [Verrucomicrobiales bacterium]HIL56140.1 asparagine--tRNA ligase [Verrucomicrobiota bacterium]